MFYIGNLVRVSAYGSQMKCPTYHILSTHSHDRYVVPKLAIKYHVYVHLYIRSLVPRGSVRMCTHMWHDLIQYMTRKRETSFQSSVCR